MAMSEISQENQEKWVSQWLSVTVASQKARSGQRGCGQKKQ